MRGSGASRLSVAPGGALAGPWVRNPLWRNARAVPSLDLQFADNKSLVDGVTGQNLVTFTRASSGTFVGSDGFLKTAVTNLVLRSEEFNNASWTKTGVTVATNSIASPTGALTADKLVESSIDETHRLEQLITFVASSSYSTSFYAKAAERNIVFTRNFFPGQGSYNCAFDLSNGTVQFNGLGQTGAITDVGNGWYRCSVTASTTSAGTGGIRIGVAATAITSDANPTYLGDGTSGLFLWGAQLEQSSTVGEYVPTTSAINSAPRFDHNPTTGESLGLMVEEARTNLIIDSELFSGALWFPGNLSVASTTATTAPDGSNNAIKFAENTVASQFHFINYSVTKAASAIQYTYSVYAKAAGRELGFSVANSNGGFIARFNLANGTITVAAAAYGTGFIAQASIITPVGNGWYRCSLTGTTNATTSVTAQFSTYNTELATNVYTGNGTSGFFLWGAQLEAGAFPTSYIPTTTATVTRAADVASITGSNFSSWYNQTEGTVFAEGSILNTGVNRFIADITDSGTTEEIALYWSTGFNSLVNDNGVSQANSFGGTVTANSRTLHSFGYRLNDFQGYGNGTALATDTSGTLPTVDRLTIGSRVNSTFSTNGTIKRLTFWPTRLSNTVLQQITQ